LRLFVLRGQHVALIRVKFGVGESTESPSRERRLLRLCQLFSFSIWYLILSHSTAEDGTVCVWLVCVTDCGMSTVDLVCEYSKVTKSLCAVFALITSASSAEHMTGERDRTESSALCSAAYNYTHCRIALLNRLKCAHWFKRHHLTWM